MLDQTWEDQYRRMKRSYATAKGDASQKDTALDALFHFCCDVLHLRDWIVESAPPLDNIDPKDLDKLFKTSNRVGDRWAVRACADVAIAAKHFVPHKRTYPTAKLIGHNRGSTLPFTLPARLGPSHFVIDIDGKPRSAMEVADAAIAEWDEWLKSHGLELPS